MSLEYTEARRMTTITQSMGGSIHTLASCSHNTGSGVILFEGRLVNGTSKWETRGKALKIVF